MAAIVTKFGGSGFARPSTRDPRAGRVARVSAKAVKRAKAKVADDEPELDPDTLAGDDGEVVEKKARPDAGTYLSMYFRDMAALDVLRPEEEFTAAREIEALEIMLWEAVLAHAPAVDHILSAVEEITPLPAEAKTLRKSAEQPDSKTYSKVVARAARKLRAADSDHLFIDAGTIIPGFSLAADNVEFFCHSPFIKHCDGGDIIRNMHKALKADGLDRDPLTFQIHDGPPAKPIVGRVVA